MQNLITRILNVAVAAKREKNTEHTRMYIFFLDFPHHYSQQRSAVRSTAKTTNQTYQNSGNRSDTAN